MAKLTAIPYRRQADYLTLRQISEEFNIPLGTLRVWGSLRKFPLYKINNGRIRVHREEFSEWINKFYIKPINADSQNFRDE